MKSRLLLSSIHAECMHDDEPESVFLDYKKILMTLTNLLVVSTTEPFIEHLSDDDETTPANWLWLPRMVGHKEKTHMDEQAGHIVQRISYKYVSILMSKGFNKGGNPFDSWHITFTDFTQINFSAYYGSVLAT
jgi:hypothetical protein